MSKFIKAATAILSNDRYYESKPPNLDWLNSTYAIREEISFDYLNAYDFSVTWSQRFYLRPSDESEYHAAINSCRANLTHAVYGDFVGLIYKLEGAIYRRDYVEALECLKDIRKEVL